MKPLSECTTPRRLMAPISRHFLPVLQPEPPAWLTTGLIKGSRRPLALYLLSRAGLLSSSVGPVGGARLTATGALIGASLFLAAALGATATGATETTFTRAPPLWSALLTCAPCAFGEDEAVEVELNTIVGICDGACAAAFGDARSSAALVAAFSWLLTAFIVVLVFWIMLGFWAEAKPAAHTQTRTVIVIAVIGFVFVVIVVAWFIVSLPISSPAFRACWPGPVLDRGHD